jgi:hypothetical protein
MLADTGTLSRICNLKQHLTTYQKLADICTPSRLPKVAKAIAQLQGQAINLGVREKKTGIKVLSLTTDTAIIKI